MAVPDAGLTSEVRQTDDDHRGVRQGSQRKSIWSAGAFDPAFRPSRRMNSQPANGTGFRLSLSPLHSPSRRDFPGETTGHFLSTTKGSKHTKQRSGMIHREAAEADSLVIPPVVDQPLGIGARSAGIAEHS